MDISRQCLHPGSFCLNQLSNEGHAELVLHAELGLQSAESVVRIVLVTITEEPHCSGPIAVDRLGNADLPPGEDFKSCPQFLIP